MTPAPPDSTEGPGRLRLPYGRFRKLRAFQTIPVMPCARQARTSRLWNC